MKQRTDFLYLSEPDMIEAGVLDVKNCVNVVEEVFSLIGKGDYLMGGPNGNDHGIKMTFPDESEFPNMPLNGPDRRFMAMIGYLGGKFNVAGEKWYGSNIANPARGLPRSVLRVMLNDPDTCEPFALMSANLVSAMRTGAVPGVAVRYLTDNNAKVCAVVGAGPVNFSCVRAILSECPSLKKLVIFDLFTDKADSFGQNITEEFGVEYSVVSELDEALKEADVVSVAASRVKPVVLKGDQLKDNCLVLQTGAMQGDDAFWRDFNVVLDNPKMHEAYVADVKKSSDPEAANKAMMCGDMYDRIEAGEVKPLQQMTSLGDIINDKTFTKPEGKTLFISGGQIAMDLGWSYQIYQQAKEKGIGTPLNLWQEPHWL